MCSKDSSALHIPVPACKTVLMDISSLRYVYHFTFHVQICALLPPANEVWGKVIFLHLSVILFTGGEYLGRYTPQQVHPLGRCTLGQVHPLGRYTPQAGTPHWAGTPPWVGTPPRQVHPPIRMSMRGRYASYWNAFLLFSWQRNFSSIRVTNTKTFQ